MDRRVRCYGVEGRGLPGVGVLCTDLLGHLFEIWLHLLRGVLDAGHDEGEVVSGRRSHCLLMKTRVGD